jgi:hypothetical protein
MVENHRIVISASRRTDIPAFYMKWFMDSVEKGAFEVVNPYNRRRRLVPVTPEKVHTVVFWSKNYRPFISGGFDRRLQEAGYRLYFNFTVNSDAPLLEPNVPPLADRLAQLAYLCRTFDPRAVTWRFDPVCFYSPGPGDRCDNLSDFDRIAKTAAECGVKRCITSFMDDYAKIRRRVAALPGFSLIAPSMEEQKAIIQDMHGKLDDLGIALQTCCEKAVLESLPTGLGVEASACIPNALLMEIYGGRLPLGKDAGQRVKQGCGCNVSTDIGSYALHPCYHNCLFCYANPAIPAFQL